ncbi:MAG: hypothetical protein ACREPU_02490 [Rhodanobacteraceae bacterium]
MGEPYPIHLIRCPTAVLDFCFDPVVEHGRGERVLKAVRSRRACSDFTYEIVDLADWILPMDDEPAIPASGRYTQPHTRA